LKKKKKNHNAKSRQECKRNIVLLQAKPDIPYLNSQIFRSKIAIQHPLKNAKEHDTVIMQAKPDIP
jgi:hypothetical protein